MKCMQSSELFGQLTFGKVSRTLECPIGPIGPIEGKDIFLPQGPKS